MNGRWLLLAAFGCSGLAGLIYEMVWVRALTLYLGHTTAATSTVLAAFMGGMAAGSAIGGRVAGRLGTHSALVGYALLEAVVIVSAIALPAELSASMLPLRWAYREGNPGSVFPAVRLLTCFAVLAVPTLALGATFPFAVRSFATGPHPPTGASAGPLYAANTAGAALGLVAAGFFLIPAIGVSGTTLVGVAASALAIGAVLVMARRVGAGRTPVPSVGGQKKAARPGGSPKARADRPVQACPRWLGVVTLASTGFATFVYEITWTRIFSTLIGPSTYAFAATGAGIIGGLAVGSACGSALVKRVRRPETALAMALLAAVVAANAASIYAGALPLTMARRFAGSQSYGQLLLTNSVLAAALIAPIAVALGAAFPLSLEIAGARRGRDESGEAPAVARRIGVLYAINTLASVGGSLAAGFILLPAIGLQHTLRLADFVLIGAAVVVFIAAALPVRGRAVGMVSSVAAIAIVLLIPPWDRALMASGGYKYALYVPEGLDLSTALKAGTLLFYREGPTGIVTVKRLTGNLSLAIDGKVDASTSADMLTQKTLAHLPLLLHGGARTICIIGLGSGVTLASALAHPIGAADVVEISQEVVEASHLFAPFNHRALDDPRTRLILGDGRSHLALSSAQYDVIISEPSNPWMAGVAALFTREFFETVRDRLAPGGILCQWVHTYDISDADLRSVVQTFASVFPQGTMWLVGNGDLLLLGSAEPLDARLENIAAGLSRPAVAADLTAAAMRDPFGLLSMFVGGPGELATFGGGARIQRDDRMALEFSGPRSVNGPDAASNAAALRTLLSGRPAPPAIARALSSAGAGQWRDRGAMMAAAGAHEAAYQDFMTASRLDPTDRDALLGIVNAAVPLHREAEARAALTSLAAANPAATAPRIALSRLAAATGAFAEAVAVAKDASLVEPVQPEALEQLASLYADAADAGELDAVVAELRRRFPAGATTRYYEAASSFLRGDLRNASTLAQQSITLEPRRAAAHNLLGAIQANLGQSAQARTTFQTALDLDARDSTTYINLALLELSSGNGVAAESLFSEALSLDPSSEAAREGLARARATRP